MLLRTVVLEKTLESPLDCKKIQPVHPKGNQSWIFIGRTDAEAEAPILWLPDVKSWLVRKDPEAGKDWRQEAKGMFRLVRCLHGITDSTHMSLSKLREMVKDREAWRAAVHGVAKSDWTTVLTHVCSVVSDSFWPHRLYSTRLLCPWDFPGKSTGVGCHFSLQALV